MKKIIVSKSKGFTLIELMIVVVIIAVLSAFAIPAYSAYVERGWRSEARAILLDTAQTLERNHTVNYTYAMTTPPSASKAQYTVAVTSANKNSFLVTATLLSDSRCTTLTLDQAGRRDATGVGGVDECWNK